jgi:hypothetical protein
MVGTFFRIDHDNERSFRRYRNEVWMRHCVALTARRVNFVGDEGNAPVEFPNGVYDHDDLYAAHPGLSIRCKEQWLLKRPARRAFLIEGGDAFFGFGGFASFEVVTKGTVDIFPHRGWPEFFH